MNTANLARATLSRLAGRKAAKSPLVAVDNRPASLLDFTLKTKPDYVVNWHHELICETLDRFAQGEIKRLMIFAPPRHGKSELVSRRLPAYLLGLYPDAQVISCSYSADLASRMNRDVQRIIDHERYRELFPETKLFGDNVRTLAKGTYLRNSDMFEVVGHNGSYRSAGVGGGIAGMGYNFGIIDDPIKNRKEAASKTVRQALWEWYTSTFYTRQEKDASILLTMTRYEKDDIAGRAIEGVLDENGEEWVILSIPAIAEGLLHPDDPRQDGEALWPYKYSEQKLRKIRATIGEFEWSAQYQQNPIPSGGLLFKPELFEVVDYVPECTQVVRFYDLAVTKNKTSDYTAGVKMGLTPDNRPVVLDVYRAQKPLPEIQEAIVSNARIDGTQVFIRLEAEKAGIIGLDYLLRDKRLNLYTLDIKAPDGDKYTRATPFAARVNASHALLVRGAWNHAYLEELGAFNKGTNDDMVDASSGAYDMLAGGFGTELLFEVNNELEDND